MAVRIANTSTARADRERIRRTAARAAREQNTLDMLADRLPDYEPRVEFPALWQDVKHIRGVLGRDGFYELLTRLDGAHVGEDLIVRIISHDRAARRVVVVRPRASEDEQRTYLRRWLDRGRSHPPRPVSYAVAHARIAAQRGRASTHACAGCGAGPAAEWSYQGLSPDEQVGWVSALDDSGVTSQSLRLWSPTPADYSPLCSRCHAELDESGVLWGDCTVPTPRPAPIASTPSAPLPPSAPAWMRSRTARVAALD